MRRERTKKNCVSTPSIFIVILSNLCFFHFSDSDSDFFSNIVGNFFLGYYNFFWCSITSHSVLNLNSNEMKDDALWGVASFLAANPSVRILTLQDQGEF